MSCLAAAMSRNRTMSRPRIRAGATSAMQTGTMLDAPPTASPSTNLAVMRMPTPGARRGCRTHREDRRNRDDHLAAAVDHG